MRKRKDFEKILIIGSGPIVIGQACEFDYSGAQACKALRAEGYKVILVNSNPATIMTDPEMADVTYIEPVTWQMLEAVIARERPDALLPTMGGQTGLNCALDLARHGVLEKHKVEMIGASREAIDKAEDREKFKQAMARIGLECPRSASAHSMEEALQVQVSIGFPAVIRPSFTLGGSGGGIAYNREEFVAICERGLEASPTHELLIEESVIGWKEFEMEVVRDRRDNCIIVCSIENLDPMGVHTGDSITVAPAQTLTDKEYQIMRDAAIAVLREIGVDTVGYTLDELKNEITGGATPASFEPTIDYIVTKVPRFAFEKFPQANDRLTTQMKSVGEVMAIGRTFQESFQKALRGLEIGVDGLNQRTRDRETLEKELGEPGPERIWYVGDAFENGFTLEEVHRLTHIDPWFLDQIKQIVELEMELDDTRLEDVSKEMLFELKRKGFSDRRLAYLFNSSEAQVRAARHGFGIRPVYKRVDTCAAEFATRTAYMYSTYEEECEASPTQRKKVIVLGGGPNRIGQGIEFDYCCVHAALALREDGFETIMVNCNPETVSTDYDTSDKLYFEPLTLEDTLALIRREEPDGVVVQFGGQTPLRLAVPLERAGVPIIGTAPDSIDRAEDRERFEEVLAKLDLKRPPNGVARSAEEAVRVAAAIGYPILVRPSYVLGGRAMEIVYDGESLARYMRVAVRVSPAHPVLIDQFLEDAVEVDVDAVSDGAEVVIGGIMEHIERAGVHSGDSACSLPPYSLDAEVQAEIRRQTVALARELGVVGLMNVQFAVKARVVYVLEVNPRASRTVPFVSKAIGVPLAKLAARCMVGRSLAAQGCTREIVPAHVNVKEAVFPFIKFPGVDTVLGPEMKSTGEVMGIDGSFGAAFAKAQIAASTALPTGGQAFISVPQADYEGVVPVARRLSRAGFSLLATRGTGAHLRAAGLVVEVVNKVSEGGPHIVDALRRGEVALVVNTPAGADSQRDAFHIRRTALECRVPYFTTLAAAAAAAEGIDLMGRGPFTVRPLQEHHRRA